jgi:hypothetical protein
MVGFEMFCERCGKRYGNGEASNSGSLPLSKRLLKAVGVSVSAPPAPAGEPLLRFCLACRGYSCPECWNDGAGFCQTCVPVEEQPGAAPMELPTPAAAFLAFGEPTLEPTPVFEPPAEPVLEGAPDPLLSFQADEESVPWAADEDEDATPEAPPVATFAEEVVEHQPVAEFEAVDVEAVGEFEAVSDFEPVAEVEAVGEFEALGVEPAAAFADDVAQPEPVTGFEPVVEIEPVMAAEAVVEAEAEAVESAEAAHAEEVSDVAEVTHTFVMAERPIELVFADEEAVEPEPEASWDWGFVAETEAASVDANAPVAAEPVAAEPSYPEPVAAESPEPGTLIDAPVVPPQPEVLPPPVYRPLPPLGPIVPPPPPAAASAPPRIDFDALEPPPAFVIAPPQAQVLMRPTLPAGLFDGPSPQIRPCHNCDLPVSAKARFCRRCGSAQPTG